MPKVYLFNQSTEMCLKGYEDDLGRSVRIRTIQPKFSYSYCPKKVETSSGPTTVWVDIADFKKKFSDEPRLIEKYCTIQEIKKEIDKPYSVKTQNLWKKMAQFTTTPPSLAEVERLQNLKVWPEKMSYLVDRRENELGRNLFVTPLGQKYICMTRSFNLGDRILSEGAYKKLKVAIDRDTLSTSVLATFYKHENPGYKKEIRVLEKLLDVPEIVQLQGVVETEMKVYLLMEHCARGNLWDFLQKKPNLSRQKKIELALDYAKGLAKMHKLEIIHRDLKPQNLLLTANLRGKICDFGDASIEGSAGGPGTTVFWDPSMAQDRKLPPDPKGDVWALGTIFYSLFHPQHALLPHQNQTVQELKNLSQPQIEEIKDLRVQNLLKGMLQISREKRFDTDRVVKSLETLLKP